MNVLVNKHNRVNPVSGPRRQQKGVESFFGLYYSSSWFCATVKTFTIRCVQI